MQIRITARYEETKGKVGVFTTPHISDDNKRYGHKFFINKDALKYYKFDNANQEHQDYCDCVECSGMTELKKGYNYHLTIGCSYFKTKKQSALYLNRVKPCLSQKDMKVISTTMSVLVLETHAMKIDEQTTITRIKVSPYENNSNRYTYLGYKSNNEPKIEINEWYTFDCMLFNKSHYDENGLPVKNEYETFKIEGKEYQRYYTEALAIQYTRVNSPVPQKTPQPVQETPQPVQETPQPVQSRFSKRR